MAARTSSASPSVSPSQDALSLQVSLSQMLDLALGTPEVGAYNMNILHNFLHVLLHQIDLRSTKVEYRGQDANRLKSIINTLKPASTLELHEYKIIDTSGGSVHRASRKDSGVSAEVYTDTGESGKGGKLSTSAPTTARSKSGAQGSVTSVDDASGSPAAKKSTGVKQQIGSGAGGERQSIIFVEQVVDGTTPSALGFKRLEDAVKELQQKFQAMDEIANNPEMIERVRTSTGAPLSDMWHGINVSKRLDASEQGIEKLTTMVEDLIKGEKVEGGSGGGNFSEELTNLGERVLQLESQLAYLGGDISELKSGMSNQAEEISLKKEETEKVEQEVGVQVATNIPVSTSEPSEQPEGEKKRPSTSARRSVIGGIDLTELKQDVSKLKSEMSTVKQDVQELSSKIVDIETGIDTAPAEAGGNTGKTTSVAGPDASSVSNDKETDSDSTNAASKKTASKTSVERRASSGLIARTEGALKGIDSRVGDLEKEVVCITARIKSEFGDDGTCVISAIATKIQTIQTDMENMNKIVTRFMEEKESRDNHTDALMEQIELLKTIKADKEDLEDALADKADAHAVNRKVSHDQFDAACDDLARGLEDAITKLGQQESIWQQALDEVQREIEGKLDKLEISPLKEFVNNRVKLLQDKLKALAEMRRESEAAGTKKMLSDVQCISCDANVVMKMEEGIQFRAPAMHCAKSMKPYLTYELDQVRKQQKKLPNSRNMIQFEAAMKEMTRKAKPLKEDAVANSPRDHLCNRYCGGSHTITTPQQRVMRMGHFLTQWGPEVVQLSEGLVVGNDGQLYRSRPVPGKPDAGETSGRDQGAVSHSPTPSAPEPAPNSQRQSQTAQRRSNTSQGQKRLSARKTSKTEEIPPKQSTPPSAPPGTVVDEGDAVPEPAGPTDEVVQEPSEGGNQTPAESIKEENTEEGQGEEA